MMQNNIKVPTNPHDIIVMMIESAQKTSSVPIHLIKRYIHKGFII